MLGSRIVDPEGVEGGGEIVGINLLPIQTEFASEKRRSRTTARVLRVEGTLAMLSGAELDGYEIHMGQTVLSESAKPLVLLESGAMEGCVLGNVYGSYLHGFFDSAACREAVLSSLCKKKGVSLKMEAFDLKAYKESQYDLLAKGIRESLDMKLIYGILEEGI